MYLVFDTENRGVYGEAFAFGAKLTRNNGDNVDEFFASCPYTEAAPNPYDSVEETDAWLLANVIPVLPEPDCVTPEDVRAVFADVYADCAKFAESIDESLILAADVAFPCEAGFLFACRKDGHLFPVYPLVDVSSVLLAFGFDPLGTYTRNADELPVHNPINDARQSSRILHALLR